ncbi:hypothetical protein A5739_11385 [Mycobacterium colombiense]|uniref:hypothetical protein n=1 Tax=Mycobacterium colombiense TaxID=339268 RepID=UPI00096C6F9A|nr:hypothetical protein [Mycobacterium colombiense]OMC32015.1 hypothetical protein A5739_11385 [Mycobacterium colombiense]
MHDDYTYQVRYSPEDGEHVAIVAEFPSLSHLDADAARALDGIVQLVNDVVADMKARGEVIPPR